MDGMLVQPSARKNHASVYYQKVEPNNVIRKYMLLYGGLGTDCPNGCSDLWKYEIAWASQWYY